jgi:hypothetical protein
LISLLLALVLVVPAIGLTVEGADSDPVNIALDGPTRVGLAEKHTYKLIITGGPEGNNTTYSWSGALSGENSAEATMVPATGGPLKVGTFFFNLTSPQNSGDLTIEIEANANNPAGGNTSESKEFTIDVVNPITLEATVKNIGNATAVNVPVMFFLNDDPADPLLIYNTTVTLAPNATQDLKYNWTSYHIGSGQHTILMEIDPNGTMVTFSNGNKTMEQDIYYKMQGADQYNIYLWVLVIALVIIVFLLWRRPNPKKKRRKK